MIFSDLIPFYNEDLPYGSIVEDCELAEVVFYETPRLTAPEEGVKGSCHYIDLGYDSFINALDIKEECFAAPMRDLAFIILVPISMSLLRKGVILLQRYVFKFVYEVYFLSSVSSVYIHDL